MARDREARWPFGPARRALAHGKCGRDARRRYIPGAVPLNDLIGFVAAVLTTSAFVPQAWMTWKTRSAHGVSLGMYVVFVLGVALWLWYGINLGSLPIIAANAVTLSLATFILVMKVRFG